MTFWVIATAFDVTVKVIDVAPLRTLTDDGTVANKVFELVRVTTSPAAGAGPLKVTVPAVLEPPTTEFGATARLVRDGARIEIVPIAVWVPDFAVIVAEVVLATAWVVTGNVMEDAPAGIATDFGTVALAAVKVTVTPPGGAAPVRLTVPVADVPPKSGFGLMVTVERDAAVTLSVAL